MLDFEHAREHMVVAHIPAPRAPSSESGGAKFALQWSKSRPLAWRSLSEVSAGVSGTALGEAIAVAVHLEDADVMGQARRTTWCLAHPRFGDFVREEWIPALRRSEIEQRYIAWGERTLRIGSGTAPAKPSAYLIKHFGAHLERAHAAQDRFALLTSRSWADLWYSIDPSLSGFLADVDRRRRAAVSRVWLRYGCFDFDPFAALLPGNVGMVHQDTMAMVQKV